jgi:hypothetical protein
LLVDIEKITVKAAFQIKTGLNWAAPAIDLGQTCDARWHLMACIIKRKVPGEIVIVRWCMRARPDK